jgi:hypothetical protein
MDEEKINDNREQSYFKGITFSKHNKSEVKKALIENITDGKIESACHWTAELICAGHFFDLWELILLYVSKNIHLGNPKLVFYLDDRYKVFKNLVENANYNAIIELRNNLNIRKLFTEIFCILCQSKKMHSIELIKINTTEAFIPNNINERLKATSMCYLEPFFRPDDPRALFIPINEFSYSISCDSQDLTSACYWIEWIIEYEILHKKMKEHIVCSTRENIDVDEQFQTDSIWIVWDSIIHYSKEKPLFVQNLLSSLLSLFCIKYTTSICKKRRYILYYAVGILIENVKTDIDISDDKETLSNVVNKTNVVYLQLKQNEDNTIIRSDCFIDKRKRAEVSMKKLEMMDGALLH